MNFIRQDLDDYCASVSSEPSAALQAIERETHIKTIQPRMLSGNLQGRFLSFISHLMQPQFILEIGTFTGYSALCLAEGLGPQGKLLTIEVNPELEFIFKPHLENSKYSQNISYQIGDARELIPQIEEQIDLAFVDADKQSYWEYFEMLVPKMAKGGVILVDNVLWSGKVMDPEAKDKKTEALKIFNQKVGQDPRVEKVLMPMRDGIFMIRKL